MGIFYGIGRGVYQFRWVVLAVWVVFLGVGAFLAPQTEERLSGGGDITIPGSESQEVQELLDEEFSTSPSTFLILFENDGLGARSDEFVEAEQGALDRVSEMPEVSQVISYTETEQDSFISEDGEKSYAVVGMDVSEEEAEGLLGEVRERADSGELETYVTGAPAAASDIKESSQESLVRAEIYAVPIAAVILVIALGGLVAAGIPVIVGAFSVVTTLGVVYFLAGSFEISIFVSNIAAMLGLGLGIDYALLAVNRFREELKEHPVPEATARMVGTAGRTIFFSGAAVMIGLSGLFFFPFSILRSVGVGGVLVVLTTVLAATTLAPAVLGILGERINLLSIGSRGRRSRERGGLWRSVGRVAMRLPLATVVVMLVLVGAMVYPLLSVQTGLADAQALPENQESRAGDEILRQDFDYPSLNPAQVAVNLPEDATTTESLTTIRDLDEQIEDTRNVAEVNSLYTVGSGAAEEYANGLTQAREDAERQAQEQTDLAVEQQLQELESQFGTVPPGSEAEIRDQAEQQSQQEIDSQIPSLPEGLSPDGEVTPGGVANFLDTDVARDNEELQGAIETFASGDQAVIQAVPDGDPYSQEARDMAGELRNLEAPAGVGISVGGLSAQHLDTLDAFYGQTALYAIIFVLIATYAALALSFRSLLIPLKALVVNALSIAASLGVLVLIYQQGNLSGILDFTPLGFLDAIVPLLVFCVVFGISMDYEVFMISRVQEAHDRGESTEDSISEALGSTGGVVASAAAILMVVTGAFAFTDILQIKVLGLGIAVAVFVAAFLMQMILVPAIMRLLGEAVWWPGRRNKKHEKQKS